MADLTTKCGNIYSQREWNEMMENWAKEIATINDELEQEDAILSQAARMLEPIAGQKAYSVAKHLYEFSTEGIQFTNESNRELAETVSAWIAQEARYL